MARARLGQLSAYPQRVIRPIVRKMNDMAEEKMLHKYPRYETSTESTDISPPRNCLTELPEDVQILILSELATLKDLLSLAQTCKHFYRLHSTSDRVWCSRLLKDLYVDYARHPSAFLSQDNQSARLTYRRLYPHKWAKPGIWWSDYRRGRHAGSLELSSYNYDHQTFQWRTYCCHDGSLPGTDPNCSPGDKTQHLFQWVNNHAVVQSRYIRSSLDFIDYYGCIAEVDPDRVDHRAPEIVDSGDVDPYSEAEEALLRVNQCYNHNFSLASQSPESRTWPPYCIPASDRVVISTDLPDEAEPRHPPFSETLFKIATTSVMWNTEYAPPPYNTTRRLPVLDEDVWTYHRLDESLLYPTESQPYQGLWSCSYKEMRSTMSECVLILQSAEHPEKLNAIAVICSQGVAAGETRFCVNNLNEKRRRPDKYLSWRDKDVVSCETQVKDMDPDTSKCAPGELVLVDKNCLVLCQPVPERHPDENPNWVPPFEEDDGDNLDEVVHYGASEPIPEPLSAAVSSPSSSPIIAPTSASTIAASDPLDNTDCLLLFYKRVIFKPMQTKQLQVTPLSLHN